MPLYTLLCLNPTCGHLTKQIVSVRDRDEQLCPKCDHHLEAQLPSSVNTQALEMRDARRGKQLPKGHEGTMKKRMRKHHDQYEIQEKIDKYGMDDALRYGWVKQKK